MRCPACGVEAVEQASICHQVRRRLGRRDDRQDRRRAPARTGEVSPRPSRQASATAQPPEEELWRGGYSSKAMIGAWVVSGLIVAGVAGGRHPLGREIACWLILLAVLFLPWLYCLAVLCYRRMSVRYVLTTQRFIHESGILRRVNDRIEVLDMDDITFEQGLLERLMGVGTIRIVSTDRSHPDFALRGIENVKEVAALFDNARLAERRRRGLHVEQI